MQKRFLFGNFNITVEIFFFKKTLWPFVNSYFWQAIGVRLNELCHCESESPANLLGLIYDEETKRRLRKEDEEEDFLDDSKETPFTTRTPTCKNLSFRNTYSFFFFLKNISFFFWFPFHPVFHHIFSFFLLRLSESSSNALCSSRCIKNERREK